MSETASMATAPVIAMHGITRAFRDAGGELPVLRGIDLALNAGEAVALVGPSGAGKSTLLHIAGLLERPGEGRFMLLGEDVSRLGERRRTAMRRGRIGFVYQFHHLLPEFSALENVAMPLLIAGVARREAHRQAEALLTEVGLGERLLHLPAQLSGGEQQRVAIARALIGQPALLLADEPTGNLDQDTGNRVFELLISLVRQRGLAALVATHDRGLAARFDRTVTLEGGLLTELSTG